MVLILEDLHWAMFHRCAWSMGRCVSWPSSRSLSCACRAPKSQSSFPDLWAQRRRQYMPLSGLSWRACERLIREVLGSQIRPSRKPR